MTNKYFSEEKKFWDEKGNTEYCSLSAFDQQRISGWIAWRGNGRALDIGGGSGMISRLLANQSGTDCICIDISLPMLQHGQTLSVQADALSLPFRDQSFDLVVAAAFVHHLPNREDHLLREIHRVLRPGGRVVGYDPSAQCLQNRLFMMDTPLRLALFSPDERPVYPKELINQILATGFTEPQYRVFSFMNQRISAFEAIQRYILTPLAIGPMKPFFERWFFWEAIKR